MLPRSFLALFTAATFALLLTLAAPVALVPTTPASAAPGDAGADPGTPNIVVIMTDDQRWDTLWAMPRVRNLLVNQGITFKNAFAVNPICCPSRVSFLTGNFSHTTGVYTNSTWKGSFHSFKDKSNLATWLNPTHDTAYFGKYLNKYRNKGRQGYIPPGWDMWNAFLRGSYKGFTYSVNGTVEEGGTNPYSTTDLADRAVNFIHGADEPIFMMFSPLAPHSPATPEDGDGGLYSSLPKHRPPSFNEPAYGDKPMHRYIEVPKLSPKQIKAIDAFRIRQLQSLRSVDRAVERIVVALQDTGRLENTLILYTSDNGHFWGEHRFVGKNAAYEEAIRIPYVIRWDAGISEVGTTRERIVANIDLAPTVTAITGVEAPKMDGRSLVPLLNDTNPKWRDALLIEHASRDATSPSFCMMRTPRYAYVRYSDFTQEFYDLKRDPYQLRNANGDRRYRKEQAELRGKIRAQCDPVPPAFPRRAL